MQSDDQNNYWEKDGSEDNDGQITDMYTPGQDDSDNETNNLDNDRPNLELDESDTVHWSAAEYINTEKNGLWFVIFWVVVIALIAADVLLLRSYTFSALVVVMAIAIVVMSRRPAQEVQYTLSGQQGLYVGEKLYHFSDFRAFGLIKDEGYNSIMLVPVKRFSMGVSVYFPDEVGEKIVDILGARLPMQDLKLDIVDKIVRKLRI